MNKIYFITLFLLIITNVNGQIDEEKTYDTSIADKAVEDLMKSFEMPKVVINKNLVAYTTFYSEKINGIKTESKMNSPNHNNPYYIYIKSNRNFGSITIQNKNMTADVIIDFHYIEKSKTKNGITAYFFFTKDKNIEAIYNTVNNGHNRLTITYNYSLNNSKTISYVISRI